MISYKRRWTKREAKRNHLTVDWFASAINYISMEHSSSQKKGDIENEICRNNKSFQSQISKRFWSGTNNIFNRSVYCTLTMNWELKDEWTHCWAEKPNQMCHGMEWNEQFCKNHVSYPSKWSRKMLVPHGGIQTIKTNLAIQKLYRKLIVFECSNLDSKCTSFVTNCACFRTLF